ANVTPLANPVFPNTAPWTAANPPPPPPTVGLAEVGPAPFATASTALLATFAAGSAPPPTYPHLADTVFYKAHRQNNTLDPPLAAAAVANGAGLVGGYAGDGWFKMFEFFEVPSQMIGAIGPVAQGSNFDWLRQDLRPGQLNLNLIIDEEV